MGDPLQDVSGDEEGGSEASDAGAADRGPLRAPGGPDVAIPPDPGVTMPFVHSLFTDHMVLQRQAQTPIWGWTQAGTKVTVEIAGKSFVATADQYGRWLVRIGPFEAGGPYTLAISGPKAVVFQDVFFGDVWLCSGQSNMFLSVANALNAKAEIAASDFPQLRLFTVPPLALRTPRQTLASASAWTVTGPTTTGGFSATCYVFGRALHGKLKVPIGLIHSSVGGTVAQAWTSAPALATIEDFKPALAAAAASSAPATNNTVTALYNGMIAPLLPYGIKGVTWYQGEANVGRGPQYSRLLPTLIADWRANFRMGKVPFLIVQLPNWMEAQTVAVENSDLALLRDAQLQTVLDDPQNGLAVTADIGEALTVHPRNKQDVGARLAASAFHVAYGEANVFSGPTNTGMKVEGGQIRLSFANVGTGLMVGRKLGLAPVQEVAGGVLTGFAIAGADRKYVWATATIDAQDVVVSSPQVPAPVSVRHGWGNNPPCNLYNREGLLASPFRTDPDYEIRVVFGTGSGTFRAAESVTIVANGPPIGKRFDKWVGDVQNVSDVRSPRATLTMPSRYVSIAATYVN